MNMTKNTVNAMAAVLTSYKFKVTKVTVATSEADGEIELENGVSVCINKRDMQVCIEKDGLFRFKPARTSRAAIIADLEALKA